MLWWTRNKVERRQEYPKMPVSAKQLGFTQVAKNHYSATMPRVKKRKLWVALYVHLQRFDYPVHSDSDFRRKVTEYHT